MLLKKFVILLHYLGWQLILKSKCFVTLTGNKGCLIWYERERRRRKDVMWVRHGLIFYLMLFNSEHHIFTTPFPCPKTFFFFPLPNYTLHYPSPSLSQMENKGFIFPFLLEETERCQDYQGRTPSGHCTAWSRGRCYSRRPANGWSGQLHAFHIMLSSFPNFFGSIFYGCLTSSAPYFVHNVVFFLWLIFSQ